MLFMNWFNKPVNANVGKQSHLVWVMKCWNLKINQGISSIEPTNIVSDHHFFYENLKVRRSNLIPEQIDENYLEKLKFTCFKMND